MAVERAQRRSIPRHVDAQCCVGLLAASLVDAACSFHNFFNRFVVTQFELMDHLLTVLKHANLSGEPPKPFIIITGALKFKRNITHKEHPQTHLNLTWSDIELLKDVDEESLHFIPGVDRV